MGVSIRRYDLKFVMTTTSKAIAHVLAIDRTIWSNRFIPFGHFMSKCSNFIRNISITAMTSVGRISHLGAGGLGYNHFIIVSKGINVDLRDQNRTTFGTMHAFGKSRVCAIRIYGFINNFVVLQSHKNVRIYEIEKNRMCQ